MAAIAGRTDAQDIIVLNETNKLRGAEASFSLRCCAKFLTNTPASGLGTGFGTFIGSSEFNPELDDFERDNTFEIGKITRILRGGMKLVVIGCYRSPSMSKSDTALFYSRLASMTESAIADDSVVLVGGDDNSHLDGNSSSARAAYNRLEQFRRRLGGIHLVNSPTRASGYQPDHVLSFHNPTRFKVTSLPPIPGVGDHCEMRLEVDFCAPVIPKQRWFMTDVVVDDGDPSKISSDLRARLYKFSDEDFDFVTKEAGWTKLSLDHIVEEIMRRINEVRCRHRTTQKRMMPSFPGERNSKIQRKVNYTLNKISRVHLNLKKHPNNIKFKEELHKCTQDYVKFSAELSREIIEKDIKMMSKAGKPNTSKLFREARRRHKFDDGQNLLPKSEIEKKILAAEENYYLPDGCPPFTAADFEDIEAQACFKLKPTVSRTIQIIESLTKVDKFFKEYKREIAGALTLILKIIDHTHLFPSACKMPKMTFLPNRTIFSLDFLSKFIERAVRNAWDELEPEDVFGQFAYKKNRSCELLVAVGLHRSELNEKPCFSLGIDSKKAFDTTRWSTCGRNLQRKFGAGKFFLNYTDGRSYKYNGKAGFSTRPMGRGCPPGTILGPGIFGDFQTTDEQMTLKSDAWLWPGLFSDDKQGIACWSKVLDGKVQIALDSTWNWSKDNFVSYHMTGSKRPKCYVLRKACHKGFDTSALAKLNFGGQSIEREYCSWQLGICQRYFEDTDEGNEYGYYLDWKSKKSDFGRLAHSFHDVKHTWDPDWIRTCVNAYMVGIIQYSSALYWLRAPKTSIDSVRFHYCCALAACMGMELPEIVGFADCKSRTTPANRKNYLKACEFLNLPTLRDMAIKNARNIVRQWHLFEPELFVENPDKFELGAEHERGLLHDLVNLANCEVNCWYPCYEYARERGIPDEEMGSENLPRYKAFFAKSARQATELCGDSKNTRACSLFTYFVACRFIFKCIEVTHRAKKRLSRDCLPTLERRSVKRKKKPPDKTTAAAEPNTKKPKISTLSCASDAPVIRGIKAKNPCRICGYAIGSKAAKISFSCCNLQAHKKCWDNASVSAMSSVECKNVACYLLKDKTTKRHVTEKTTDVVQTGDAYKCIDCDESIAAEDNSHTSVNCPALSRYFKPSSIEQMSCTTPIVMRSLAVVRNRFLKTTPFVPRKRDTSNRESYSRDSHQSHSLANPDITTDNHTT